MLALSWGDLLFDCSDISRAGKSIARKCGNIRLLLLIDNGVGVPFHVCGNLSRVKSHSLALLFLNGHPNDIGPLLADELVRSLLSLLEDIFAR